MPTHRWQDIRDKHLSPDSVAALKAEALAELVPPITITVGDDGSMSGSFEFNGSPYGIRSEGPVPRGEASVPFRDLMTKSLLVTALLLLMGHEDLAAHRLTEEERDLLFHARRAWHRLHP